MWAYHVLRVVKLQYQLIAKAGQQSQDTSLPLNLSPAVTSAGHLCIALKLHALVCRQAFAGLLEMCQVQNPAASGFQEFCDGRVPILCPSSSVQAYAPPVQAGLFHDCAIGNMDGGADTAAELRDLLEPARAAARETARLRSGAGHARLMAAEGDSEGAGGPGAGSGAEGGEGAGGPEAMQQDGEQCCWACGRLSGPREMGDRPCSMTELPCCQTCELV